MKQVGPVVRHWRYKPVCVCCVIWTRFHRFAHMFLCAAAHNNNMWCEAWEVINSQIPDQGVKIYSVSRVKDGGSFHHLSIVFYVLFWPYDPINHWMILSSSFFDSWARSRWWDSNSTVWRRIAETVGLHVHVYIYFISDPKIRKFGTLIRRASSNTIALFKAFWITNTQRKLDRLV